MVMSSKKAQAGPSSQATAPLFFACRCPADDSQAHRQAPAHPRHL